MHLDRFNAAKKKGFFSLVDLHSSYSFQQTPSLLTMTYWRIRRLERKCTYEPVSALASAFDAPNIFLHIPVAALYPSHRRS